MKKKDHPLKNTYYSLISNGKLERTQRSLMKNEILIAHISQFIVYWKEKNSVLANMRTPNVRIDVPWYIHSQWPLHSSELLKKSYKGAALYENTKDGIIIYDDNKNIMWNFGFSKQRISVRCPACGTEDVIYRNGKKLNAPRYVIEKKHGYHECRNCAYVSQAGEYSLNFKYQLV